MNLNISLFPEFRALTPLVPPVVDYLIRSVKGMNLNDIYVKLTLNLGISALGYIFPRSSRLTVRTAILVLKPIQECIMPLRIRSAPPRDMML